jgi:hypothetical protein
MRPRMIFRSVRRAAAAAAFSGFLVLAAWPVASHSADTLRPEVAKPLNDAQNLYRAHNYRGALGKIAQAATVPGKTSYETRVIEEMQGAAAMAAGDTGVAAEAYEALLSSGALDGASAQQFSAALAGVYFQQKNYAAAIRIAQRYQKTGGADPQMRELPVQSYFLSGDCGNVAATLKPGVDAALKGGRAPAESQLQMLAQCAQKTRQWRAGRSPGSSRRRLPQAGVPGTAVRNRAQQVGLFRLTRSRHLPSASCDRDADDSRPVHGDGPARARRGDTRRGEAGTGPGLRVGRARP